MKRAILFLPIALLITSLYTCANPINPRIKPPHLFVYAIPGQNGQGSEPWYIKELLIYINANTHNKDNITIIPVATPTTNPDLGQTRCLKELHDTLSQRTIPGIIHATSQGTATALNYVALTDKGKQIKGLILEAPLLSGNSAIYHTMSGPLMNLQWLTNLPCSYYWLPYCAKAVFPYYWPAGKQSITLLDQIPTDMPIIIIHSKNDPQLPYDDACALYYGLKKQGNNNVYFIRKKGMRHLNLIESAEDACVIQTILKKHQIIDSKGLAYMINLSAYQPDHLQFKQQYDTLLRKEIVHKRLGYTLATSSILGVAYGLYHLAKRVKHSS